MNESQVRDLLESSWSTTRALDSLKQLQLLSYEKIEPLNNRIEDKVIEKNRKKVTQEKKQTALVLSEPSPKVLNIVAFYCDLWKFRYKAETSPPIFGKDAKNLHRFLKEVGNDKAEKMLTAYFQMADTWFLTKRHDVTTFLSNTNSITQFMDSGKMITRKDINQVEKAVNMQNLFNEIDEKGFSGE